MKIKFPCKDCGTANEAEIDSVISSDVEVSMLRVVHKAVEDFPASGIRWLALAAMVAFLVVLGGCWITEYYRNEQVAGAVHSFARDTKVKKIIIEPKRNEGGWLIGYEITTEPNEPTK